MIRWTSAVALLCIVWASTASAQATGAPRINRQYWQHCWALQFGVSGAALQNFDGLGISLRRHFGQGSALRLGVSLGPFEFNESQSEQGPYVRSDEGSFQSGGFELEYLGYLGPHSNVTPFLSFGAGTGATRREVEDRLYARSWNVSLSAGFGVEWFVHQRVGVSGEYTASAQYVDQFQDVYFNSAPPQHMSTQTLLFGNSKVRMGVAVSL